MGLIVQHVSFEDALMKPFVGEWVERVLRSMGMKENESIESRMVSRRFLKEMKKIERRAIGDASADSAEEWLERNCP